jgi:chaperonin GroEL
MKNRFGEIKVGAEARKDVLDAMDFVSQAIGSTLGPAGRPFGYDKMSADGRLSASFTKDGLTVLKSLVSDNPAESAVLAYCKIASSNSVVASGDGTSSTIVLANAVAKAISEAKGRSPQAMARQIEEEARLACEAIRRDAIKGDNITKMVTLTSSNGDEELTEVVLESLKSSGAFGTVLVEKNPSSAVRYKIVKQDGYSNCAGYNYNNMLALSASEEAASSLPIEWETPHVIIYNGNLILESQINPILKIWDDTLSSNPKNLVIVAYDISDEIANKLLVVNRMTAKKGVGAFVVKPRLTAEVNSGLQVMRDIASYCGVDDSLIVDGGNYKTISLEYFGTCGKVKISPSASAFLGRADNHWVSKRVEQNESIVREARSLFDKEITSIRNAELADGLVKVEVGGGLMPDLQERADRFDDASKAAQSCMIHGALPGGGVSYIRAGFVAGVSSPLLDSLSSIFFTVLTNYGEETEYMAQFYTMLKFDGKEGYKIENGVTVGDAVEIGVLDACETVCAVIKNGVALGTSLAILGGYSFRVQNSEE